jgi:anti-sigma regulatory factor (Ser/Thr protein kinase)
MLLDTLKIAAVRAERISPNHKKEADLYSRIGYRLEEAVADLVDNSVDAHAKNVLIRFQTQIDGVHSVVIADDGDGMNEKQLREAMRIGSDSSKGQEQLGKYGTGLKSASLSQARSVTVLSRQKGVAVGRRWTHESIASGWMCDVLSPAQCKTALDMNLGPVNNETSGTLVIWEQLEHLRAAKNSVRKVVDRARKSVRIELGVKFHRLLEAEKATLWIDEADVLEDEGGEPEAVRPLNPFPEFTGRAGYPLELSTKVSEKGPALQMKLHVWPAKSKESGYKLGGGKVASRQGFYFYRNDRLIQAGGWNGLQGDDSEPHLSLARVAIELPPKLESLFKLDIGKSMMDPPAKFVLALEEGETGKVFQKYLDDAESAYRHHQKLESAKFKFTCGSGVQATVRRKIRIALSEKGLPTPVDVDIVWKELPGDELVRIGTAPARIELNNVFRKALEKDSQPAINLVKTLFVLLFQEEMGKAFVTELSRDRMRRINQALLSTISA